jgi:hypothetical protein
MATLDVKVHATHSHDSIRFDNDMVLVAEVTDATGAPVTDLDVDNFECWQVGVVGFGQVNIQLVQHLGDVNSSLKGIYHVVPRWEIFAETQCAFTLIVKRPTGDGTGNEETGRSTATLVTQGEQD